MGRPRKSVNIPPNKLTAARVERWRRGFSLHAVSARTGIPVGLLSDFERGVKVLVDADLAALAQVYGIPTTAKDVLRQEVVVPTDAVLALHGGAR